MVSFWEHGFRGVTTRDLAEAMGINPFSLYASFESKEKLFERALEYYFTAKVEQTMLLPFSKEKPDLEDIRQFFEQFVNMTTADYPRGCLICNTMVDAFGMSEQVDATLQRYREVMRAAFTKALRNAYPRADEDRIDTKADFLFGAVLGLIMQNRMGIHGAPIQNYANGILKAVSTLGE